MISIGVFCNLLVGYGSRSANRKMRILHVIPTTVSISFMLIADIDRPWNGIIRVVPQDLISTAQSLPKP
jgi:hypothetical protein